MTSGHAGDHIAGIRDIELETPTGSCSIERNGILSKLSSAKLTVMFYAVFRGA